MIKLKNAVLLFCFSVNSLCVFPQQLTINPYKTSDQKEFTSTRSKKIYTGDSLDSSSKFEFDVSWKVLSTSSQENVLEWIYKRKHPTKETTLSSTDSDVSEVLNYITRKLFSFQTLKVVYTTDRSGAILEINNTSEMREYVKKTLDQIANEESNNKKFIDILEQFRQPLLSDNYLNFAFIQEVHTYHMIFQTEITEEKTSYEITLPNPLTNEDLPGILTTEGKVNADASWSYTIEQTIDDEKITQVVQDKLKNIYTQTGKPEEQLPKLTFRIAYEYIIRKGSVAEAKFLKTAVSGETKAYEEIIIR